MTIDDMRALALLAAAVLLAWMGGHHDMAG